MLTQIRIRLDHIRTQTSFFFGFYLKYLHKDIFRIRNDRISLCSISKTGIIISLISIIYNISPLNFPQKLSLHSRTSRENFILDPIAYLKLKMLFQLFKGLNLKAIIYYYNCSLASPRTVKISMNLLERPITYLFTGM